MLSIIIPTLNESKTGYLRHILTAYCNIAQCEIICVDGGSHDNTLSLINEFNVKLIETSVRSRAGRLNIGILAATQNMILLNHPRSVVSEQGIRQLIQEQAQLSWGAFTHQFDTSHPLLKFTSWYSNVVRGDLRKIYYLDHCLFAQKSLLLEIGLVPDREIFEDTELCVKLKQKAKPKRFQAVSQTSAIRFLTNTIFKQVLLNQKLKWQYYFNRSDSLMNEEYERGLELNSHCQHVSETSTRQAVEKSSNVHS